MKALNKEKVNLPDGIYDAIWGGWVMEIITTIRKKPYSFDTNEGIKGIGYKLKVEIKDLEVYQI